jgi:Mg2+ and Co2+ transporter CorA
MVYKQIKTKIMSEDLLDDESNGTNELPQMLNVLTILTFIGSGLSLLSGLWGFFTMDSQK